MAEADEALVRFYPVFISQCIQLVLFNVWSLYTFLIELNCLHKCNTNTVAEDETRAT